MDKYQAEIDRFREAFLGRRDKRIAIYGLGRRTMTLLPGIADFQVVGLLDRESSSRGKVLCGIPVISLEEAERAADLIVISADPTNYETIYRRIAHTRLPVFYATGERAALPQEDYRYDPLWGRTEEMLRREIEAHDTISFDFFDTLAMRRVLAPTDVFRLLARRLDADFDFAAVRQQAAADAARMSAAGEATLSDIYAALGRLQGLDDAACDALRETELALEYELCVPRKPVVSLLKQAQCTGKNVFILSDTYFTWQEMKPFLAKCGLEDMPHERVLLSAECGKSKESGALWQAFSSLHSSEKILHIGDSVHADETMPRPFGIDTWRIPSAPAMFSHSSLAMLPPQARSAEDSVRLGMLAARMFEDPFALHVAKGKPIIRTARDFGYLVFGGVVSRLLLWLRALAKARAWKRCLFFARDGYFLHSDFAKMQAFMGEAGSIESAYVPISRRLICLAAMQTEADFRRVAFFPYVGSFRQYLFSRFGVVLPDDAQESRQDEDVNAARDGGMLLARLAPYRDAIWAQAKKERKQYIAFLREKDLFPRAGDVVVDFAFYGTNQYEFQRLTGAALEGCYFSAALSEQNPYHGACVLHACFNDSHDPDGMRSPVKNKGAFLESFLTAPYGMIRAIDSDGALVTEMPKRNQIHFAVKEEANEGVMDFLREEFSLLGADGRAGTEAPLVGETYAAFLSQGAEVAPTVLDGFYFDNDMAGSREMPLEV